MFIRPITVKKNGKRHGCWALVESYRTSHGPRQRVVSYLGQADASLRRGMRQRATGTPWQRMLFDDVEPAWVEVNAGGIRVERCMDFGGPWLGLALLNRLDLAELFAKCMPAGREEVPWSLLSLVLVIARLCDPSSELHIAEHFYKDTALCDLLGIGDQKINDDRLYRGLDQLLPHKETLEIHLKERLGELFGLEYDILLYDVTSTYFEGQANGNSLAQRGYSRDHRPDCKQVCIGLVVSKCGMPLGYELFAGNRHDSTTVEEIVETMERRYGKADRIWVMDRGMVSQENIELLKQDNRRYIIGTPKSMLKNFAAHIASDDWDTVHDGLEVKRCPSPDGDETFILCRSADRRKKEQAMHERFEKRIEDGLKKIEATCSKRKCDPITIAKRVGRLLGQNSRAAGLGDEPRRVFEELVKIKAVDVVLPTRSGHTIRRRCVSQPTEHQAILLQRPGLNLPKNLPLDGKFLKPM